MVKTLPNTISTTNNNNYNNENTNIDEHIFSNNFNILKILYSCDENNVIVYLVEDKLTKIEYVIKKYYCESNNKNEIEDILNESKIFSLLNESTSHKNIIKCFNFWNEYNYENGIEMFNHFIQIEKCKNENIKKFCIGKDFQTKIKYAIKITKALIYLSNKGIVHRDLKPANILIDKYNEPKIIDFGISYYENGRLIEKGTVPYQPEEQNDSNKITNKIDIFSLGIIFLEMFCEFKTFASFAMAINNLKDRKIIFQLPEKLISLILNMTEKEINKRPNAFEVLENLKQI